MLVQHHIAWNCW